MINGPRNYPRGIEWVRCCMCKSDSSMF
ncbi:hypothetical protein FHL02_02010 [Lactobacillus salsicarnum]|uniref:Uncharacterized protein n=1 Tax=Companilactobacillus mishanensis TaxID=2486008 RepID=A0A5P0ZFF2_9LACO|nr:hypothetical protein [Companilactobacillus mishanensis]MQS89096.1 hypothetical protein [Companilactobacillus mishanensis]